MDITMEWVYCAREPVSPYSNENCTILRVCAVFQGFILTRVSNFLYKSYSGVLLLLLLYLKKNKNKTQFRQKNNWGIAKNHRRDWLVEL